MDANIPSQEKGTGLIWRGVGRGSCRPGMGNINDIGGKAAGSIISSILQQPSSNPRYNISGRANPQFPIQTVQTCVRTVIPKECYHI
jgi:hypothetical protein